MRTPRTRSLVLAAALSLGAALPAVTPLIASAQAQPARVSPPDEAGGGVLRMAWENTQYSLPFTVQK